MRTVSKQIQSAYFFVLSGMMKPKGGEEMGTKSLRARVRALMMEYAYLITLGAMIAVVAASAVQFIIILTVFMKTTLAIA